MKSRPSTRCRKPKTSPDALQPKQWKNPFSGSTWNDGVFHAIRGGRAADPASLLQPGQEAILEANLGLFYALVECEDILVIGDGIEA